MQSAIEKGTGAAKATTTAAAQVDKHNPSEVSIKKGGSWRFIPCRGRLPLALGDAGAWLAELSGTAKEVLFVNRG